MNDLDRLAGHYLDRERGKGKASTTVEVYGHVLRGVLERLAARGVREPGDLTLAALNAFFEREAGRTAYGNGERPISRFALHHERTVLRGFLAYLSDRGLIAGNPAKAVDLGALRYTLKRPPSRQALLKLLSAPGPDPVGLRDRALFETLYSTGIRRAELCALDLADCDPAGMTLRVNEGKGKKDRLVPIGRKALTALRVYLMQSRPKLNPATVSLFVSQYGKRMHPMSVNDVFGRRCNQAGIDPPITPHLVRHACATHLLENGADVRHVQAILGHESLDTTALYTHLAPTHLAEVLARCHPRARLDAESFSL